MSALEGPILNGVMALQRQNPEIINLLGVGMNPVLNAAYEERQLTGYTPTTITLNARAGERVKVFTLSTQANLSAFLTKATVDGKVVFKGKVDLVASVHSTNFYSNSFNNLLIQSGVLTGKKVVLEITGGTRGATYLKLYLAWSDVK